MPSINPAYAWEAVLSRDRRDDGKFVYAVAIPCHRVVRGDGQLAGYRWGLERKKRLLALERT
jgi:O-6-methylguanine DNA methyltransferase